MPTLLNSVAMVITNAPARPGLPATIAAESAALVVVLALLLVLARLHTVRRDKAEEDA